MHIFIMSDPADRRLMHLDILSDIPEDKGFEKLDPFIQKFPLKIDDAFGHFINGPLSLMDASD